MTWMNEWEVEEARRRFDSEETPNLAYLTEVLYRLMHWTNSNSDGWPYWTKPSNAAGKLTDLLQQKEKDLREDGCVSRAGEDGVVEFTDATDAEVKKVLSPIKAFLTRHENKTGRKIDQTAIMPLPQSTRIFYRTVYQVEVLSEKPFATTTDLTLGEIASAVESGDMNGNLAALMEDQPIDARTTAKLLIKSGSDPEFFGINDHGEDVI